MLLYWRTPHTVCQRHLIHTQYTEIFLSSILLLHVTIKNILTGNIFQKKAKQFQGFSDFNCFISHIHTKKYHGATQIQD